MFIMNWLKRLLLGYFKEEFEVVYMKTGNWVVEPDEHNEYCHFSIQYSELNKKYTLIGDGFLYKSHTTYVELFKIVRELNEGTMFVKGGELFKNPTAKMNDNNIDSMNETECEVYLKQSLKNEDYELAEKIKQRLKKFNI